MTVISVSEASRRSGISRAAIRKHLKVGRIQAKNGQVDVASFEAWLANKTEINQDDDPAMERQSTGEEVFSSLPDAELHKTSYEAKLKELDYDLKSGRVVLIDDVAAAIGAQYASIRTRLLAMPAETAPQLFNCKTVTEIQDRLHLLIVRILEELSEDERWKETLSEREADLTDDPDPDQEAEPVATPRSDPKSMG